MSAIPRSVLAALLAAVLMAAAAANASAERTRIFSGSFGAAASTPADPYPLSTPSGVAVDQSSHDVYVGDGVNHRVEKFSATGDFILMFGKAVNKTAVEEHRSAEEQNLCPAAGHPGDACQEGEADSTPGAFGPTENLYLAVDNSTGPSKGDVYAGDAIDGLVQKFDGSGHLITSWGDHTNSKKELEPDGQLNGGDITTPVPGPFNKIGGIAVDTAGNLWVYGSYLKFITFGRMFEFKQDSSFATDFDPHGVQGVAQGLNSNGIAVDAEGDLYLGSSVIVKYTGTGEEIGKVNQPGEEDVRSQGLAVDAATGDLYLDAKVFSGENFIQRYDASCQPFEGLKFCTPVETFGASHLSSVGHEFHPGMAIDAESASDTLYVADPGSGQVVSFSVETVPDVVTVKPSGLTSASAMLNGTVNPSGVSLNEGLEGCRFEWGETLAYGHVAACEESAAQIGSGTSPVQVSASLAGLTPGATYHYRLVAGNANDVNERVDEPSVGADVVFGPPLVDSESVSSVTATSATLEAEISPQNADTHVRVEYLTETEFQENGESFSGAHPAVTVPEPEADLGSGAVDQGVFPHVQGLVPGTVYRYRAVAESVLGRTEGTVLAFMTQGTGGSLSSLDGREWELVSSPVLHGALIESIDEPGLANGALIQASVSGGSIAYVADAPTESNAQGYANGVQVLSIRSGSGWGSRDIATAHEAATDGSVGFGQEYRFFSEDLSVGVLQPFGAFTPSLSPEASEQTPYLRADFPSGSPGEPCSSSCYRPLVSGCPPVGHACQPSVEAHADVPPGTIFGVGTFGSTTFTCPPEPRCGPLFAGASPDGSHVVLSSSIALTSTSGSNGGLFEWSGGRLTLVSVLPGGEPTGGELGTRGLFLGDDVRHAISNDGSRVVWTRTSGAIYLRENADQQQSAIAGGVCSEPAKACTVEVGEGVFQTASADGSRVFFSGRDGHLYEYDLERSEGQRLADLTGPAELLGVPGASEDGSEIYFVANGNLTGNATSAAGQTAVAGQPNLYLHAGGATGFIATLSPADNPSWDHNLVGLTSRVSPDGDWLAFMSQRSLTGYDNRDAVSGKPDEEVYLYHAPAEGGQGELVCASCDPTGARPHGIEYEKLQESGLVSGDGGWSGSWLAANVPGWTRYALIEALYQSRYLSDSGRLFFNSSDALVPQDVNGTEDVYEYEPPGVGSCTVSSALYAAASDGCIDLVSSGSSPQESAFMDASENGDDVFFLSVAQLAGQDNETGRKLYDAHACSGESPCPPPPPPPPPACEGDACQSPASAPSDPTPGSLTFQGPGNMSPTTAPVLRPKAVAQSRSEKLAKALKACRKRPKKQRHACEKRARQADHASRKTKSSLVR